MPVGSGLRLGAARGSGLRLGAPTASTMIGKSGQGTTLSRHIQVSSASLTCILEPMIGRSQVERESEREPSHFASLAQAVYYLELGASCRC